MTTWALIAPGPSATQAQADKVKGLNVGAIGCAFQLAPWADFISASDAAWWRNYPEAKELEGKQFCMASHCHAEKITIPGIGTISNSGVLGLQCAVNLGATRILLIGFDMRGSHFFGQYTNGLRNTSPQQREQHKKQYSAWAKANPKVEVLNCTRNSALTCFPMADLDDCLAELALHRPDAGQSIQAGASEARV